MNIDLHLARVRVRGLVESLAQAPLLSEKPAVTEKLAQDYVTQVDRGLQSQIFDALEGWYPDHQILGEEGIDGPSALTSEATWIVDPLDGTSNFISGLPLYGVSLALLIQGQPHYALVYDLVHGELFDAVVGEGCNPPNGAAARKQAPAFIGMSSGTLDLLYRRAPEKMAAVRRLGKVRILGSQALQLAYVAAGRLTATISVEAKLWDDIAGALLVKESGGWYGRFDGTGFERVETLDPTENQYSIACGPELRDELTGLFEGLVDE